MRGMARVVVVAVLGMVISAGAMPSPAAAAELVDEYCSPSGDFCTRVVKKASGAIVFRIVAFADYFGQAEACVTKDTTVCRSRRPREGDVLVTWKIKWQDNYPDEGSGRYTLKWFDQNDQRIGRALHFRN